MQSLVQVIASERSDVRPGGWFKVTAEDQTTLQGVRTRDVAVMERQKEFDISGCVPPI
jgi:hypothetical protein